MPDDELTGLDIEVADDAGIEPESFDAEVDTPAEEQVDPRDARLDKIEALLAEIDPVVREARGVKATVGRVQSLEASLKRLSEQNPLSEIDPRVSANEDLTVTLARTLSNSALVDDADRASLQAALRAVEASRSARERKQMMSELKAELATTEVQPAAETSDSVAALWDTASEEVREMASEYGIAPAQIPWDEIQRNAQNNPTKVARVALKWFEANKPDPAVDRVSERRRAAGSGSPSREGATGPVITDMSDADEAYSSGAITLAQYKDYRTKYGVGLVPGGR